MLTSEIIAKRADEIFAERYTIQDILKMDTYQAKQDCFEQARQELLAEQKNICVK